jgi:hypothetical protein
MVDKLAYDYHDNEENKKQLTPLSMPSTHPVGFSLVDGLI